MCVTFHKESLTKALYRHQFYEKMTNMKLMILLDLTIMNVQGIICFIKCKIWVKARFVVNVPVDHLVNYRSVHQHVIKFKLL